MKLVTASVLTGLFFCASANAEHPRFPSGYNFGMIGLAKFDTARLNLVNTGDPNIITIIPSLCQAKLLFLDTGGRVLAKSEVVLGNGQAGHLDLTHAKTPGTAGRVQIRAQVTTLDHPVPTSGANCVATLEVFSSLSGRTYTIYPDAPQVPLDQFIIGPLPPAEPPPPPPGPGPTPIPAPATLKK